MLCGEEKKKCGKKYFFQPNNKENIDREKKSLNVNFFCSSCCTEELCSNIPAMAVLIKTGSSRHETVLHNTNLKLKNTKAFDSFKRNRTLEEKTSFSDFLYFFSFFFSFRANFLTFFLKFYILLISISIA